MFSTAEKIETIVEARASGAFGTYTEFLGGARVVVEGFTYIVQRGANGWEIQCGAFQAVNPSLYEACHDIVEVVKANGGASGVTRNVAI